MRLREAQVLEHVLEGHTQRETADAVGITQAAVSAIVRRVEERLLADLAYKVDRQRARQTLRLEHVYRQSMQAWQDSKQEGLRRRQRKTENDSSTGSTVAELISENRYGDPRFLDEARKALADLRKVWGVDAPERVSIDAVSHFASMSDKALEVELARHLRLVQPSSQAIDVTPALPPINGGNHEPKE